MEYYFCLISASSKQESSYKLKNLLQTYVKARLLREGVTCLIIDGVITHVWCLSGIGQPTFSSEDNCTYIFDWETQYACTEKPDSCQLLVGQHLFDLSALMRNSIMGLKYLHTQY